MSLQDIQNQRESLRSELSFTDKCLDTLQTISLEFYKSTTVSQRLYDTALLVLQLIPASIIEKSETLQKDLPKMVQRLIKYTTTKSPMKVLGMLRTVSINLLEAKVGFGKVHTIFLCQAIENRCYHLTREVIDHPLVLLEDTSDLANLLEFLYYSAIILMVFERYEEAAERLETLIRFEKDDSNLRLDAERKLSLLESLMGSPKAATTCKQPVYTSIANKVTGIGFTLQAPQLKTLSEDGNMGLVRRLNHCFQLSQLKNYSESHIRIPVNSLMGNDYSQLLTISNINAIKKLYRYDPIAQCVEFVRPEVDVEEEISKTVKLYLEIRSNKGREKKHRTFGMFGSGLGGLGGFGLGGFGGIGRSYGHHTSSYGYSS